MLFGAIIELIFLKFHGNLRINVLSSSRGKHYINAPIFSDIFLPKIKTNEKKYSLKVLGRGNPSTTGRYRDIWALGARQPRIQAAGTTHVSRRIHYYINCYSAILNGISPLVKNIS